MFRHFRNAFMFAGILLAASKVQAQISTFDSNSQGWQVVSFSDLSQNRYGIAGIYTPTYFVSGGNSGGYISIADPDDGDFTFSAPAAYLGNKSTATDISYDLTHTGGVDYQYADLMLTGNGTRLIWKSSPDIIPNAGWTSVSVSFTPSANWHVNTTNGALATFSNFQNVLSSLNGLYIRGEFFTDVMKRQAWTMSASIPFKQECQNRACLPCSRQSG